MAILLDAIIGSSISEGLDADINKGYRILPAIGGSISQGLVFDYQYGYAILPDVGASISVGLDADYKKRTFIPADMGQSQSQGYEFNIIAHHRVSIQVANVAESISKFNLPILRINGDLIVSINDIIEDLSEGFGTLISTGISEIIEPNIAESTSAGLSIVLTDNLIDNIDTGDDVYLLVSDSNGNLNIYKGIIRKREPRDRILSINAITGDGILADRIIKEDYPEQDVGLTAKQIVDTYCSPLTTTNINTETGIIAPVPADGKTALSVFENIRRNHGILYYVDNEWDVNLYLENEIEDSNFASETNRGYKIKLGDG